MLRRVRIPAARGPEHSTAEAAIDFAAAFDQRSRRGHEHLVLGKRISQIEWDENTVVIGTEGGQSIALCIEANNVACSVQEIGDHRLTSESASEVIELRFSPALTVVWDRSAVAAGLVGETLKNVFVTPNRLLLYVSQPAQIVAISVLMDADTGAPFLYWDFSE